MMKIRSLSQILTLLVILAGDISAQTKFHIPTGPPNYSSYLYVEDCVGAVSRINALPKVQAQIVDTFRAERKLIYNPVSQPAKDTALICSNKWSLDTVPSRILYEVATDFMMIGRMRDVKKAYKKYIDSIPPEERVKAKRQLSSLYFVHLDKAELDDALEAWFDASSETPKDSFAWLMSGRSAAIQVWSGIGEIARADSSLDEYIRYVESASPEQKKQYQRAMSFIADAIYKDALFLKQDIVLEKLSESTSQYSQYLRELLIKIGEETPRPTPLDSTAPTLLGKWWYGPRFTDGKVSIAKVSVDSSLVSWHGKVNAIAFIPAGCHTSAPKGDERNVFERQNGTKKFCAATLSAINRLKEASPNLNVIIATRTFGSFGDLVTESPEKEAETLARYFIENYKVKAYVAVEETEMFSLPGLDKRRVDLPTQNETNFSIANFRLTQDYNVVLVDPEGKIFYTGSITGDNESIAQNLIDVVTKRSQLNTSK